MTNITNVPPEIILDILQYLVPRVPLVGDDDNIRCMSPILESWAYFMKKRREAKFLESPKSTPLEEISLNSGKLG